MEKIIASDLRIGNFFFNATIQSISNDGYNCFYNESDFICWNTFDSLIPITITEEILLEYSFEAKPLDLFVYDEISVFIDKERNKVRITFEGFFIILNTKYLHELQNAIFALTSKELKKT